MYKKQMRETPNLPRALEYVASDIKFVHDRFGSSQGLCAETDWEKKN